MLKQDLACNAKTKQMLKQNMGAKIDVARFQNLTTIIENKWGWKLEKNWENPPSTQIYWFLWKNVP